MFNQQGLYTWPVRMQDHILKQAKITCAVLEIDAELVIIFQDISVLLLVESPPKQIYSLPI